MDAAPPTPEPDTGHEAEPTVVVLLAAGGGSRFGGREHKLLALLDGRPVAEHAISTALDAGVGPVVVVTGATDLLGVDADLLDRVHVVANPDWADGQSTSLRVAVETARDRFAAGAIVVGLADQPGVAAEAWRRVAASASPVAVATYDGARRNPVRLDRAVWNLLPESGDVGARLLVRLRPDIVEEVPCPGSAADIDTLEDLRTWQSRSSTNSP